MNNSDKRRRDERIKRAYDNRRRTVRMQKLALMIIFTVSLLSGIIAVSSNVYAGSSCKDSVKMYKSVTIYAGDTIESIAGDYVCDNSINMTRYIKEIASINNITPDTKLIPGNHIIVPYYENTNSYNFIISMN